MVSIKPPERELESAGEGGTDVVGTAEQSPKTPAAKEAEGKSQKSDQEPDHESEAPMDFDEELDDEIQIYYEKEEIEQTNEIQQRDQFEDIFELKSQFMGDRQTKYNILEFVSKPKVPEKVSKKKKNEKEGDDKSG